MYRFFKIPGDDEGVEAGQASEVQPPPISDAEFKKASDDALLDAIATLSQTNGMSVVQHGARLAVIGELLVSLLVHMPASMRADIVKSFRQRVEGLMSLSDDMRLPGEFHAALLTEVNRYLNALQKSN